MKTYGKTVLTISIIGLWSMVMYSSMSYYNQSRSPASADASAPVVQKSLLY